MRLWSLHPQYLDTKGLVACWREGLLARKVLKGETQGYRNHPQLERFKAQRDPVAVLDRYLSAVLEDATRRGFTFNHEKIGPRFSRLRLVVTRGQLEFELCHLTAKLKMRDVQQYEKVVNILSPLANPIFRVIDGGIESWEKVR
jgi:hypothetical protein